MVAVERFTGHRITFDDLARIEQSGIGFRFVPHLPMLYPYAPWPDDASPVGREPLRDRISALIGLPAEQAHDLAWWIAAAVAQGAGQADDPDVAATVGAVATTAEAVGSRPGRPAEGWLGFSVWASRSRRAS
jgi:hypothetical protein